MLIFLVSGGEIRFETIFNMLTFLRTVAFITATQRSEYHFYPARGGFSISYGFGSGYRRRYNR